MVCHNPLQITLPHIGKGHIIPLQKRQAGIIVLKIQRVPHPLWHLVDKAENAFVAAGLVFIHQAVFKLNAQIIFVFFFDLQFPFFPRPFADKDSKVFFVGEIFIVKYILDFMPIYGQQHIPWLQFQFFRNAAWLYFTNGMFFQH